MAYGKNFNRSLSAKEYTVNIVLICATPAGSNNGMISVDLAFNSIKNHLPDNVNVTRLCAWKSIKKHNDLEYKELIDITQLENADKIIFWGDFLHWIEYAKKDWTKCFLNKYPHMSEIEIINKWYELYLLENRIDLQKKVIVFGSTLYGLNSFQLLDKRYKSALTSLYSNALHISFRDILSSNYLGQLINDRKHSLFGCDCALLLEHNIHKSESSNYFLYSFGRSGSNDVLEKLALDIGNKIGLTPVNLEWLKKGASPDTLFKNLEIIKNSKFVLTDIYHCAVNSYREEIKVICIGNGASTIVNTLSDKKKEIFHLQHLFSNNYFYLENIKENYNKELDKMITLIKNEEYFNHSFSLLLEHVREVKKNLINLILK